MEYEEIPVGSNSATGLPTGTAAVGRQSPNEDFSNLPLDALLMHKNWKARKEGFEKVRDDPEHLRAHLLEKAGKFLGESNASAQEALFEAFAALVGVCDDDELDILTGVPLKMVIEKGITGRPKAVQVSHSFLEDLVGAGKHIQVMDAILPAFAHKTPKNRMVAAQFCSQIIGDYGVQSFPTKAILKAMQPLFNDANAQVRKEALTLCCQCYKFIGAAIKGFLTDLRDVQLQELEKLFENVTVGEVPKKHIRGQSMVTPTKPAAPIAGLASHSGPSNGMDDAAFELCDETPVLPKLPRNFFRMALDKSAKWQDRVAVVQDNLLPLLVAPKIRLRDDYHELASMVKEFLMDPQAPLMLLGFKCIQELARSMRGAFASYARTYLNPLFEKMKDKKTSVVEHITTTLETLIRYKCVTLDQCQEDFELTVQSRVPNQRLALTAWLIRLTEKLDRSQFNRLSRAHNMLGRLINDEKLEIRDASCVLVARLIALLGENAFQPLLNSLDEKHRAKLLTATSNAIHSHQTNTPMCSPAKKTLRVETRDGPGSRGVAKPRSMSIGALNSGSSSSTSMRGMRPSSAMPRASSPDVRRNLPLDDAVALESTLPSKDEALRLMLGLMGGDTQIVPFLRSKEWSNRQTGVMKVRELVDAWSPKQCTQYLDTTVVYLRVDPGWRESIFQVFHLMIVVLQGLITRALTVSPGAAYAIIAGITPRLTEAKNKMAVRDLITCLTKSQGVSFVMRHMITVVAAIKTPRLTQECNEFMTQLLHAFPTAPVDARNVVDYAKTHGLESSTPAVRSSAITLLIALRQHAGPIVDRYLSNVAPAARHAYEEALAQSGVIGGGVGGGGGGGVGLGGSETDSRRVSAYEVQRVTPPVSPSRVQRVQSSSPARAQPPRRQETNTAKNPATAVLFPSNGADTAQAQANQWSQRTLSLQENEEDLAGTMGGEEGGRVDVSPQLLLLARQIMHAADWRERLDAVRRVEELLVTHNRCIAPAGVTEILRSLRSRFDEANKNFVCDVLRTVSLVVESAGDAACRQGLRGALPGVLGMLGDQKAALREEARNLAYLAVASLGIEPLLQPMLKPLTAESHVCNQIALEVMERGFKSMEPEMVLPRASVLALVGPVVRLCMSRILEVRGAAERVIGVFFTLLGDEPVLRAVQSLRPAEQQSVRTSIERQLQIYLRDKNEEDMRHANVTSGLPSSRRPSAATPRSPRSPRSPISPRRENRPGVDPPQRTHTTTTRGVLSRESPLQSQAPTPPATQHLQQQQPFQQPQQLQPHRGRFVSSSEELLSIQEIMVGLRSASTSTAATTCVEFLRRLQNGEDCGTPEMIQVMVERLYENTRSTDVELASGLIACLKAIFETPRCAQRCHSSLLFRMLGSIFDCLLSESFSLQESLIKSLNNMTLKLLEGCPGNDVFSALMSRMTRYSSTYIETGKKSDLKYIQVTVKCLMRVDFDAVSPDNVVLCCHEYLMQHPPSSFRNLDDLSIRTVKTVLQDVSRRCGPPLLDTADRLVGSQNLVTHFIRACLESQERSLRSRTESERTSVEREPSRYPQQQQPQQHVTGGSMTRERIVGRPSAARGQHGTHADPYALSSPRTDTQTSAREEKSVANIFARIRNHVTSGEGLVELYAFLKAHPHSPDFDQQFQRCSEAFRSYIKRKMERQMLEDPTKPSGFVLPEILRLAS